ncbi:MAG: hypothetical protein DHS20C21_02450 [Gemmatimonadota bacterium]|nr:MAG: hypothetical protein DHS20C21_02450 [Gemmatimonadota bacterium]
MSTTSLAVQPLPVHARSGCGTLESPWTGWEDQLEAPSASGPVEFTFEAGCWGVSRPIRLHGGTVLRPDPTGTGRPWFLPLEEMDAIFRIDGAHLVTLTGLCFHGRGGKSRHGLFVRAGTRLQVDGCRFGDFAHPDGAALRICGESEDRYVRGVVIQSCHFVNGTVGVRLDSHLSDLLVTDNRFDEFRGPCVQVDPHDHWVDYGLIFVKNRVTASGKDRVGPMFLVGPGAEGIRIADNDLSGPDSSDAPAQEEWSAIEVRGGGPRSRRRVEVLSNRLVGVAGPAVSARQCGPGFLLAGNHITACGTAESAALELTACHGVLVEDNEIEEPIGAAIRTVDCAVSRVNANEIRGLAESNSPRGGAGGVVVKGRGTRRLRITDNRISGLRAPGVLVERGTGIRVVGNEVHDCGEGIRVSGGRNLLVVGNDCRDNGGGGIRVDEPVIRGLVALNYAILNGPVDLEVLGQRISCDRNKVDQAGTIPGESPLDRSADMV